VEALDKFFKALHILKGERMKKAVIIMALIIISPAFNCAKRAEFPSFDLTDCEIVDVATSGKSDSAQVVERFQETYRMVEPKVYSEEYLRAIGVTGIYSEAGISDAFENIGQPGHDSGDYYSACALFVYYMRESDFFTNVEAFQDGHRFLVDCFDGERHALRIRLDRRITYLIDYDERTYITLQR
jgi:hypothetical protein